MSDEEKNPENDIQEGRDQIKEGAQKVMEGGLQKGKRKKEDLKYYRRNRSEIMQDLGFHFGEQKEPATQGFVVLLPLLIVGFVISWLFEKIEAVPYNSLLNFTDYYIINQSVKLTALLAFGTMLVTAAGKVVATTTGFKLEKAIDRFVGKIPFLGSIYRITKVTAETIVDGTEELSKPVKVEIGEVRLTAFKTDNKTEDGREILFMPTAPNITSGLILEVKPENIIDTDESPEKALTRTLSAGFGHKSGKEENKEENM